MIILIIILILILLLFFVFYIYWSRNDGKYNKYNKYNNVVNVSHEIITQKIEKREYQVVNNKFKWAIDNNSILTYSQFGKKGNTGNQLFEIASTLGIAHKNKCRVAFPSLSGLDINKLFDLNLPLLEPNTSINDTIPEYDNYEDIVIPDTDNKVYSINGYRQTWKYFEEIKDNLIETFVIRPELIDKFRENINEKIWIGMHVRRSDAASNGPFAGFSIPQIKYYIESVKYIREQIGSDIKVIVSTDDPEWVTTNLEISNMSINPVSDKEMDFINLYLADYTIIGVSTFSWWAAYLNPKKKITICPTPWWNPDKKITRMFSLQHSPITDKSWLHFRYDTGALVPEYPYDSDKWNTKSSIARSARAYITS